MGDFDGLVDAVACPDHPGYGISGNGACHLTEAETTHAVGDNPEAPTLVADERVLVVIPHITYVCAGTVVIQSGLPSSELDEIQVKIVSEIS